MGFLHGASGAVFVPAVGPVQAAEDGGGDVIDCPAGAEDGSSSGAEVKMIEGE